MINMNSALNGNNTFQDVSMKLGEDVTSFAQISQIVSQKLGKVVNLTSFADVDVCIALNPSVVQGGGSNSGGGSSTPAQTTPTPTTPASTPSTQTEPEATEPATETTAE